MQVGYPMCVHVVDENVAAYVRELDKNVLISHISISSSLNLFRLNISYSVFS